MPPWRSPRAPRQRRRGDATSPERPTHRREPRAPSRVPGCQSTGKDAVGDRPQIGERRVHRGLGAGQEVAVRGQSGTSHAQVEGGADQPLLRPVVQITFDALPLGIRRGNHAPAGRLDVCEARLTDGRQFRVAQRQTSRGREFRGASPPSRRHRAGTAAAGPASSASSTHQPTRWMSMTSCPAGSTHRPSPGTAKWRSRIASPRSRSTDSGSASRDTSRSTAFRVRLTRMTATMTAAPSKPIAPDGRTRSPHRRRGRPSSSTLRPPCTPATTMPRQPRPRPEREVAVEFATPPVRPPAPRDGERRRDHDGGVRAQRALGERCDVVAASAAGTVGERVVAGQMDEPAGSRKQPRPAAPMIGLAWRANASPRGPILRPRAAPLRALRREGHPTTTTTQPTRGAAVRSRPPTTRPRPVDARERRPHRCRDNQDRREGKHQNGRRHAVLHRHRGILASEPDHRRDSEDRRPHRRKHAGVPQPLMSRPQRCRAGHRPHCASRRSTADPCFPHRYPTLPRWAPAPPFRTVQTSAHD